ncbi:16S rRNA (guanine(966)-N(2))-methyltransferase RsmD [Tetragenococcus koreensis]|uniref:16S rRNA (guanine(966)-N(2))-methyltransferase RsmD n=1 Tax=Tetragenococcus koreensis TaxID=290335 RepID=UPI000F50E1EB|nr:16S rRNA (guanine(966)-N(2))-methyltransferase RsmD [Tetragenococcus koreensis]AYW45142.1 16S rRNA (guanine(966)-N(2))-methyltransferase RsmD [Tetragenococcus koreensis]
MEGSAILRVISGNYRKMALKSLSMDTTRPTTDKIKESLFNMIGPYFNGEHVLDLYSGSGALAIEAVSRGAEYAVCVEKYYPAMKIIQENIRLTKDEQKFVTLKLTAKKALLQLAQNEERFDLVFLDPPYAKQTILHDIDQLLDLGLLAQEAVVICETDKDVDLPEEIQTLRRIRSQVYGITKVSIYRNEA